jgi:Dockerin type I domain/FG-GAP-like repeat/von Willebrand factor type A domain
MFKLIFAILIFSFIFPCQSVYSDPIFDTKISFDVGGAPRSVFAVDLDGDSDHDLAVANARDGNVSILLNHGYGSFNMAKNYSVRNRPRSVFAADFDGDADFDLAAVNTVAGNVSILINKGDGTFKKTVNYNVGDTPRSIISADLDGDSDYDLAVANRISNNVSILLNNGDGTFSAAFNYDTGRRPSSVFSADLDGDSDFDLAVTAALDDSVSILLNNGDGTFPTPVNYAVGDFPNSVFAVDLDSDSDFDLSVTNTTSGDISILMNNGDGTFQIAVNYTAGTEPSSVFSADFDDDSDYDLVVANEGSDNVSILLNNNDGTFQPAVNYDAGSSPSSVFSTDFDGDTDYDLAVTNLNSNSVSILFNNTIVLEHRVVTILDRSGSMSLSDPLGNSRLERAKALAHEDIGKLLNPEDNSYPGIYQIAVMYFNADGITLQQDFTNDPDLLADAIDAIPNPKHDTPLASAMCQAHCMLADLDALFKFVITYTDGRENESSNFDICEICDPCNYLMETGWNFDCDPSDPASCTEWQLCLVDQFASNGINIIHYFGEPLNPFDNSKSENGLEDLYFLKSAAEGNNGGFFYHSDQEANGYFCGDANRDFNVNISDAICIINYIFVGGNTPEPIESGDANCDGTVNVSDAVYIINYIFVGGNAPCDMNGDTEPDC